MSNTENQTNEQLALAYQVGDPAALPMLWMQVEQLARRMIRPYIGLAFKNRGADCDDLMQAAFLATERAARAYGEDRGGFATVMGFYVKSEVAALLGLHGRVRREHYEAVSISLPIGDEGDMTLGDTLEDTSLPDKDESLMRDDVAREVRAALDRLKHPQGEVVRAYHLDGATLGELAAQMNVSPERVRQIRAKGEKMLRWDRQLRALTADTLCWRYKSAEAFRRDWTSVVEAAVMRG